MSRVRIQVPEQFIFRCEIPVRISDINYGGHVGNDSILSIIHETRMQFLASLGYTEMSMAGFGLIMADAAIEFRAEIFYGEKMVASLAVENMSKIGFDLFYKLEKESEGKKILAAMAKTGMICYDYHLKKIVPVPEEAKRKLEGKPF